MFVLKTLAAAKSAGQEKSLQVRQATYFDLLVFIRLHREFKRLGWILNPEEA